MSLSPGSRLGPYEVVSALGAGGMGEVYRARDTRLGRDVAIKVLPAAFAADPDRLRRFEQEARAIATLNHPHICQIYDVGEGYLVLEYVEGQPVGGPMSLEQAVRLAVQMASAMEAAHARGILHRDLKPANILLTRTGQVKLLDFGLAKSMTAEADVTRTTDGAVLGTPAYMSPEQAEGKTLDARSDIFSFGAVFYELLAGTRAFAGPTTAQVVSAVLRDDPPMRQVPPPLHHLVSRCLAKQPGQRFQSMTDVRAALEQLSAKPADRQPSIAVLPFENMSGDKENEYFSDGLAEEIINALTRIPGLKVIARTSAFAFKGKHEDIRRIAETLGVSNVLEGSVRRAGSRIRVTAQLIAAADGSHLWSERYDREMIDVFAIQDEIAAAITAALKVTLSAAVPVRSHVPDLAAYEQYLRALHESQHWTPQSLARAQEYLERAIALDSRFALAHAELGHVFHRLAIYGILSPREALPLFRREARRALVIDSTLPEGHAMLGTVAAMFDFDWQEAESQFQIAMASGSAPPRVHRYYAHYCLLPQGRTREALDHHAVGLQGDPLNLEERLERAVVLRAASKAAEADEELRQILVIDDANWFPYFMLGVNAALDGRPEEALRIAETAYSRAPWFKPIVGLYAAVLKGAGQLDRAAPLIEQLRPTDGYGDPIGSAMFHLLSGDLEASADWVEKAIDQRQPAVFFFLNGHAQALRSSPRWPALMRAMNLKP